MGESGPHLLTTEILQTLLAARDKPPQNSYPKFRDPEPFEGEKAKFKTFLAQCELKFRTEGNRFDNDEKKTGYVSSLLQGVAWNWVETFFNQEGGINLTWCYTLNTTGRNSDTDRAGRYRKLVTRS